MTEELEKISSNNWEDSTVITAEGTNVEVVEDFCHLDSYVGPIENSCDKECMYDKNCKSDVFWGRLVNIWKTKTQPRSEN